MEFLDPQFLVQSLGYAGIFSIVFFESGMFFAFWLPGDSLLFSAGFLASAGLLNVTHVMIGVAISSFFGMLGAYFFGLRIGVRIFHKEGSLFFDPKNIFRTQEFYSKYGKLTLIISRFVPIVRTFAPILAGVGRMNFRTFLIYSVISSVLWSVIVVGAGYFFGAQIPSLHDYVLPAVSVAFLLTFLPVFWGIWKNYLHKRSFMKDKNNPANNSEI